nr:MAG TPA: hypothetical protein [Caudoviricetes sp.]
MERKFEEIKQEILRRAHEANACKEQYGRAYKAEDMAGLCRVIKDNWNWCCIWNVVTPDLLEKYREEFAGQLIYMNVDTDKGFLFASGNATVRAWGNATVRAWDNATVEASGNAYCTSYWIIECKLSEKALYRVRSTNTVYFASDDLEFVKQDPTQQES